MLLAELRQRGPHVAGGRHAVPAGSLRWQYHGRPGPLKRRRSPLCVTAKHLGLLGESGQIDGSVISMVSYNGRIKFGWTRVKHVASILSGSKSASVHRS